MAINLGNDFKEAAPRMTQRRFGADLSAAFSAPKDSWKPQVAPTASVPFSLDQA